MCFFCSAARSTTFWCWQHDCDTTTVLCCVHFYTNCAATPWTVLYVLYTHCLYDFNTSHQLSSLVTSTNSETLHADGLLLLSAYTKHLHVIHQQNTHELLHKRWWDTQIGSREPYGTSSKAKGQTYPDYGQTQSIVILGRRQLMSRFFLKQTTNSSQISIHHDHTTT